MTTKMEKKELKGELKEQKSKRFPPKERTLAPSIPPPFLFVFDLSYVN